MVIVVMAFSPVAGSLLASRGNRDTLETAGTGLALLTENEPKLTKRGVGHGRCNRKRAGSGAGPL
ncbi:hypothetical protein AGR9A_Lc60038 [Agrobacterium salinitolerans str. Hayward 0363]|nr:hypothetical protein AGR9A_Lc60038 [Agrobacterium salinitolerans str. Hayward 0363]